MSYYYLVTVSDEIRSLERVVFTYRDEAVFFANRRRKQGYIVTIKPITNTEKEI